MPLLCSLSLCFPVLSNCPRAGSWSCRSCVAPLVFALLSRRGRRGSHGQLDWSGPFTSARVSRRGVLRLGLAHSHWRAPPGPGRLFDGRGAFLELRSCSCRSCVPCLCASPSCLIVLEPGPGLAALASLLWSLRFCLVAEGEGRMANLIGLVRSLLRAFPGGVYFSIFPREFFLSFFSPPQIGLPVRRCSSSPLRCPGLAPFVCRSFLLIRSGVDRSSVFLFK